MIFASVMSTSDSINFERIREAIEFIDTHYKRQPGLEEIASHVHLSPFHFQRMFKEWAGISPKQFLQYISVEQAKKCLKEGESSLFDAAYQVGLSGTGRLHDLFVKIEGMTPGEYKNGGKSLSINYSYATTLFGRVLIATTQKGICYMAFVKEEAIALKELQSLFPNATCRNCSDEMHQKALSILSFRSSSPDLIRLHLKGTDFQLKIWQALLKIPSGQLTTYGAIARYTDHPQAVRAVGSAVGKNPVAYLIPCHRVILSTGAFGEYHWDGARKKAIIGREQSVR